MTEPCCDWEGICLCNPIETMKSAYCARCKFYWGIDSGYGKCKALPGLMVVPWCRDTCGLFTRA